MAIKKLLPPSQLSNYESQYSSFVLVRLKWRAPFLKAGYRKVWQTKINLLSNASIVFEAKNLLNLEIIYENWDGRSNSKTTLETRKLRKHTSEGNRRIVNSQFVELQWRQSMPKSLIYMDLEGCKLKNRSILMSNHTWPL